MPFVLLAALFAGLGIALIAIPGVEQKVSHAIEDINGSMVQGVTGPIIQAWMIVAVLGAGLGLTIWAIEHKIGQRTGQVVALPDVQPIGIPAAPTFGSSSGFSAGPFRSSVSSGGGQAPPALPGPSQPIFAPALRDAQQRSDRQAAARRASQERQQQRSSQQQQQKRQQQARDREAAESRRRFDAQRTDTLNRERLARQAQAQDMGNLTAAARRGQPRPAASGGTVRVNRQTRSK